MKRVIGLFICILIVASAALSNTFVSRTGTRAWGTQGDWASGGTAGHNTPVAGDSVVIVSGCTMSFGGANQACGSIVVAGTLRANQTLTTARTLTVNGAAITVTGTISNANGNVNLTVASPAAPVLSGAGTINFYTITINSGAGLVLGRAYTMTSGATLNLNGPLTLGNNNLTVTGVTVSGTSRVVTNGTGLLRRYIAAAGVFSFPIGVSSTIANPVSLTAGVADTFGVRVNTGISPAAPAPADGVNLTWRITRSGSGTVTPTFNWVAAQATGYFATGTLPGGATPDVFAATDGTNWSDRGLLTISGTSATMTSSLLDYNISLGLADGTTSPLPVQLASFKASSVSAQGVTIDWQTVSESNCLGFVVLRSSAVNGTYTQVSDFIAGNGTTLDQHSYSFTDASPLAGTSYYKLRQVDLDQKVTDYEPISVEVAVVVVADVTPNKLAPRVFRLEQNYPNPFNPMTTIRFTVARSGQATLVVYNTLGQQVATLFSGMAEAGTYHTVRFDGSQLASGLYFYRLQSDGQSQIARMALVK